MNKPIPLVLLEKYVNGMCTDEEAALVKQWYQSFERNSDSTTGMGLTEEEELKERIYSRILQGLDLEANDGQPKTNYPLRKWSLVAGIAAVLVLAILSIVFYSHPVLKSRQLAVADESPVIIAVTNNTNQIYKAVLSDKSTVWLSPHAQLQYPKVFGAEVRRVSMSGECFFEVTKNPQRPFIIQSRSMITKVWGTSFKVRDDAKNAYVTVKTGKVSVRINKTGDNISPLLKLEKGEVMLYPNQSVTYVLDKHVLKPQLHTTVAPELQQWNRLNLSFDNQPLSEIIPVLNAKYHVHIVTGRAQLNHYILNADMAGFNLSDVLEALKKSLNVSYVIKDSIIELE